MKTRQGKKFYAVPDYERGRITEEQWMQSPKK